MDFLIIGLSFPNKIRKELQSLTKTLPGVLWTEEENFHLPIRSIGPIPPQDAIDIENILEEVDFSPFFLQLHGVIFMKAEANRGSLLVKVKESPSLKSLKSQIEKGLIPYGRKKKEWEPLVTLGKVEHLNEERLIFFLQSHEGFQTEPFEINHFSLFRIHKTPKKILYEEIARFP